MGTKRPMTPQELDKFVTWLLENYPTAMTM